MFGKDLDIMLVLVCPCEYRVYFVVCSVPNYVVDYYRGAGQKSLAVLQKSSNLSVRV